MLPQHPTGDSDSSFTSYYDEVVKLAHELAIGDPTLPRYRRAPSRIDNGSHPHQFSSPQNYYRHYTF